MSQRIQDDAFTIRKHIREAEAVTDEAMMACAKLKQSILQARQNPEIGVDAGQRAMIRLQKAEEQALAMSNSLLRVHQELNDIGREYMGPDGENVATPMAPMAVDGREMAISG